MADNRIKTYTKDVKPCDGCQTPTPKTERTILPYEKGKIEVCGPCQQDFIQPLDNDNPPDIGGG